MHRTPDETPAAPQGLLLVERVLGNRHDAAWSTRLERVTVDHLRLDQWQAQKNRFRKTTESGLEIAVSLDRAEQPVRLLVVDSMAGVFAPLMGGRGSMLASSAVARVGRRLKEQALRLRLAVLLTSNVVIDNVGGGHKPALGTTHMSTPCTRVMMQQVPAEPGQPQRVAARLVRSRRSSVTDPAVSFVAPALALAMPPPHSPPPPPRPRPAC